MYFDNDCDKTMQYGSNYLFCKYSIKTYVTDTLEIKTAEWGVLNLKEQKRQENHPQ